MKVYVVYDPTYDGGLLGVYTDKEYAEYMAKEHYFNHPKVIDRQEYIVYEMELIVSTKPRTEVKQ